MPAKQRRLLDSFALLAFLGGERGSEKVRAAFRDARSAGDRLLLNEISAGEVYYIAARKRSREQAEAFLAHLGRLPLRLVSNSFDQVIEAARIKAQLSISYADAFAVATAIRERAVILTGDPEFRALRHLAAVEWL